MPTLKKLNEAVGTNFRRWTEVYEVVKGSQDKGKDQAEHPKASPNSSNRLAQYFTPTDVERSLYEGRFRTQKRAGPEYWQEYDICRCLRDRIGVTREALAGELGIPLNALKNYEWGKGGGSEQVISDYWLGWCKSPQPARPTPEKPVTVENPPHYVNDSDGWHTRPPTKGFQRDYQERQANNYSDIILKYNGVSTGEGQVKMVRLNARALNAYWDPKDGSIIWGYRRGEYYAVGANSDEIREIADVDKVVWFEGRDMRTLFVNPQCLGEMKSAKSSEPMPDAPQAIHNLSVTWNPETLAVATRSNGEKTMFLEGTATGDLLANKCNISSGILYFVPKNNRKISVGGSPRGSVFLNGEIVGECKMGISPGDQWDDIPKECFDEYGDVLQATVSLSQEWIKKIAAACGKQIS